MKRWFAPLLAALALAWLISPGEGFAEPDSYYHLRYAALWSRGEVPRGTFPWASASTWATAFADKDWLFHVALAPFVRALPELAGGKVATFAFAVGLLAALGAFLARREANVAFAALAFLSSRLFLERVVALRTLTPAVALFVLLLLALLERRAVLALVVALLYPLTYTAVHVPLLLAAAVALGLRIKDERIDRRCVFAVFAGTLAGVALHPDFPRNLGLAWDQNALVLAHAWSSSRLGLEQANEFRAFPVGYVVWTSGPLVLALALVSGLVRLADRSVARWQGPLLALGWLALAGVARLLGTGTDVATTRAALAFGAPLWLAVAALLAASVRRQGSLRADTAVVLLVTLAATVATALSARFVEYLGPLAFLALALVVRDVRGDERLRALLRSRSAVAGLVLVALPVLYGCLETLRTESWLAKGAPAARHESAARYLRGAAAKGEVVFHSRWDAFPELFFFAPEQRYVVALDPAFLWLADPDHRRYDLWDSVNRGTRSPRECGSRFIVTDTSIERFSGLGVRLREERRAGRAWLRDLDGTIEVWELAR